MRVKWMCIVALGACGDVEGKMIDAAIRIDSPPTIDGPMIDTAPTCVAAPGNQRARWRAENNGDDHGGTFNGVGVGGLSYTPGKYGMAFLLDGTDDALKVDDGDLLWPTGSLTLEAWVKKNSQTIGTVVIQKYACGDQCPTGSPQASTAAFSIAIAANGNPGFSFRPDSTTANPNAVDTTLSATLSNVADNSWHHIVGVRDANANMAFLYVDGQLAASVSAAAVQFGPMTNADNSLDHVTIGAGIIGGQTTLASLYAGAIDDIAIYHSALSASDVAAIYNAPQGKCL